MLSRQRQRGFSMVELAVVLTIMGILIALGMPTLSEYMANARLGSTAQSFYNGMNLARSEAIRRNAQVEFAMTSTPIAAGIENSLVPAANGTNWVVRYQDPTDATCTPYCLPVETKTALSSSASTSLSTLRAPSTSTGTLTDG
jgi:prepilin-type N-terminal cleavage/methylation domain-containing protein